MSRPNQTGLPDRLKTGIENLSGYSMDNVRVHYNSDRPAPLQAHAYTQGTNIHIAPGQEKHLPHEAWHVVQQMQGRVKPTMQLNGGVNVNDNVGLEKEADSMGERAIPLKSSKQDSPSQLKKTSIAQTGSVQLRSRISILNGKQLTRETFTDGEATVQRVVTAVYANGVKLNEDREKPDDQSAYKALDRLAPEFGGEAWFNSINEMDLWIQSRGRMEGIGLWDRRWMNFTGKGPVVFGEEHNEIKENFIAALHITHRLIEGAAERTLTGVPDKNIPDSGIATEAHKKYDGGKDAKALENYWLRAGQYMSYHFVHFENDLRSIFYGKDKFIREIREIDSLIELINTVTETIPVLGSNEITDKINMRLRITKIHLSNALSSGLQEILTEGKEKTGRSWKVYSMNQLVPTLKKSGKGRELFVNVSVFKDSIEELAYLNFKANATLADLEADELTKDDESALTVWAGRRELFILKNLTESLNQSPKPLIVTMGAAHAINQEARIKSIIGSGTLVIGSIVDLANFGAKKAKKT